MCDTQAKQQTEQVLLQHSKRYPSMTPCDAVKLLYQNEFGGGHLIKDPQASLLRLKEEYGRITHDTSAPLCEDIGNGYARLNLHALDDTVLSLDMVNRIFVQSSSELSGTREAFQQKLELLTTLTAKGVFHFAEDSLHQYLTEYAAQGYPAVSHSQIYRESYTPSYRVIRKEYFAYLPLICAGLSLLSQSTAAGSSQQETGVNTSHIATVTRPILMAIDGNSASGKTTAANLLGGLFEATVIHMDDFFLPFSMRTKERLSEPGGNVHYERFKQEILEPLSVGKVPVYRVFNCGIGDYDKTVSCNLTPLVIIEGAYCMHPYLEHPYDITAFFQVSPAEQEKRILQRNGEAQYQNFKTKWIPMEQTYFTAFSIPESCQFTVRTEEFL